MQSAKEVMSVALMGMYNAASAMDDARINKGAATAKDGEQSGQSHDFVNSEAASAELQSPPNAAACPEVSGLLSLPWEMVTHIASHLPAHCVISVLPKVCDALSNVGKDKTTWQLRARRLIGTEASFPLRPREDLDWPFACLEMETLITRWTKVAQVVTKEPRADADLQNGQPDGAALMELERMAAYDDDEGAFLEEMGAQLPPVAHEAQLREVPEGRLDDNPQPMIEEDGARFLFDHPDHGQDLLQPGFRGNAGLVEKERQPPRSASPPPALECVTLLSGHIAQVDSVLLIGGQGSVCATGSRDRDVKLWNLQADSSHMLMHTLRGQGHFNTHQGWVWSLASQGPLLASGGFDSTVKLWDLRAGGAERGVIRTQAAVTCLSYLPDVLLAGTLNEKIQMYDPRAGVPLVRTLRHHSYAVFCLAADDKYIISASRDRSLVVHDRRADKSVYKVRLRSYLYSMSYSDGEIWGGDIGGMLHCFSMQQGVWKHLAHFDVGHTAKVTGIHKSPGSLYTCSSDFTVKVHIPCGPPKTICTLRHQEGVCGLSVEAGVLAVASRDMCVDIWRPKKNDL
ncbi:F-box/WD repeat-containing protein 9 isoform X1 [Syngnathus scovelli]|uniref:F-box/WD repeat-containing protein 9 isoform X1 n=1 Tax=Syngnathus scovelli TaxID=161590 RepID=UPI00210F90BA|nr:F-box/WD repeat-containing protein 9 isoform X1 [Syngnathus scovelli]